jgi:hypothetical protein
MFYAMPARKDAGARGRGASFTAALAGAWLWLLLQPMAAAHAQGMEPSPKTLSLSANMGAGFMRGGHGGLMSGQRAPIALDVEALTVREPHWLVGGALRMELEDAMAVAAIPRAVLRHPFGPLELRPGVGLPIYFAPRTMIGPEVRLGLKLAIGSELGLLVNFSAAAFMIGNDVPHGSTVLMFHLFLGLELFI